MIVLPTKTDLPSKKPILLIVFNPVCSHCQETARELTEFQKELAGFQIVTVTLNSLSEMNAFAEKFELKQMKNLVLGKDLYYLMPGFYDIKSLPFLAVYDKKGRLIKDLHGQLTLSNIITHFKKD